VNTEHRALAQEQKAASSLPQDIIYLQARAHLDPIKQAHQNALGRPDVPFNDDAVIAPLKVLLAAHPMRAATKSQAAIHEAAHFILYERLGFLATIADICGQPFGRGGWGGSARRWNSPLFYWMEDWYPDAFLRDAQAMLAGPIAEELIGEGEALSSVGEVVAASILVRRAAELLGRDDIEMWDETLLGTVALLERYRPEILDIAALLERKKRISCTDRPVKKILTRVMARPRPGRIDMGSVSDRGLAMAHKITKVSREFAQ
jgi:hypothetical protein